MPMNLWGGKYPVTYRMHRNAYEVVWKYVIKKWSIWKFNIAMASLPVFDLWNVMNFHGSACITSPVKDVRKLTHQADSMSLGSLFPSCCIPTCCLFWTWSLSFSIQYMQLLLFPFAGLTCNKAEGVTHKTHTHSQRPQTRGLPTQAATGTTLPLAAHTCTPTTFT